MDVHVYIGVTDLQHGIEFYTRGLGLHLRRRLGAGAVRQGELRRRAVVSRSSDG